MEDYVSLYKKEQTKVVYNQDDEALSGKGGEFAIEVKLPSVESFFGKEWSEAIKEIDGYGMPPHKQKYDTYRDKGYFELPPKLSSLSDVILSKRNLKEGDSRALYPEDYFDEIESDPVYYKDEIDWIKLQIKRSYQGYWCFINGTPTYIDGWHYTYLNWTRIENAKRADRLPFFRDVDRRIFLFFKWAYTTKEATFKYKLEYRQAGKIVHKYFNNKLSALNFCRVKKLGSNYIIDEGSFLVEKSHRTCFGVVFPKRRRVGATFMGSHVGFRIASDTSMGTFAIQALTEDTAKEDVYQNKIMKPFHHYPFFFKPSHKVHTTSELNFVPRQKVILGEMIEHGGWIKPRSSSNKAFDGNLLHAYINDEAGKKKDANILHEFADTIKNALAQGENIHGFAFYTSTFGEFESGGGKEYFDLCKKSVSYKRNDLGYTQTGLVTLFIPAYDGYDGYVDEFGYSIIDDPEMPYKNMEGEIKQEGAKSALLETRRFYEENKSWDLLNAELRNNPFNIGEAASRASTSNFWNINILRDRIAHLRFKDETLTRRVDLEWSSGRMSPVRVVEPKAGTEGKFVVSYLPPEDERNRLEFDGINGYFKPSVMHVGKFILGTDPFSFNAEDTTGKKKSNGGGALYYTKDVNADTILGDKISERFCVTYNERPDTVDEYCDDMLKLAVLTNALVNTERNVPHIITKFKEWGADGYLMYMKNPLTGILEKVAGIRTVLDVKERIFSKIGDYINHEGHRECHLDFLEQIMEAQSFDDMTDLDLFTAAGMALLGAESDYGAILRDSGSPLDGADIIEMYD